MKPYLAVGLTAVLSRVTFTLAQSEAVGKLPALGWNSWNAYHCEINEEKIKAAADELIELGLKDAGYTYVNIDDCWSIKTGRDPDTNELMPNTTRFPSGIKGVADYVHDIGLKLGIYSSAGTVTCAEYPASLGYEDLDAASFAAWGIDYLKYDNCGVPSDWTDKYEACVPDQSEKLDNGTCLDLERQAPEGYDWSTSLTVERYRRMRDALLAQNRTILYSLCNWGNAEVWTWAQDVGASYRMSKDIESTWESILELMNENSFLMNYNHFGCHNDPDMLEVGNGDLTLAEQRTHFALWALMKSPLLIGTDMSMLTDDELSILKNPYLLAFNQDADNEKPAEPFKWGINPDWTFNASFPAEYWAGDSLQGVFVAMMNTLEEPVNKTAEFSEIPPLAGSPSGAYELVDVWTGESLGRFEGSYTAVVDAHDTAVVVATASNEL